VWVEGVALPVKARLVVACDGPFSRVRRQVVGDAEPTFDVGRSLPRCRTLPARCRCAYSRPLPACCTTHHPCIGVNGRCAQLGCSLHSPAFFPEPTPAAAYPRPPCAPFPPAQDTVLLVGRLPGDQVATTPCDYDAWWLRPGQAFISHPLADGDVAWEAVVNTSLLGPGSGYRSVRAAGGGGAGELGALRRPLILQAELLRGRTVMAAFALDLSRMAHAFQPVVYHTIQLPAGGTRARGALCPSQRARRGSARRCSRWGMQRGDAQACPPTIQRQTYSSYPPARSVATSVPARYLHAKAHLPAAPDISAGRDPHARVHPAGGAGAVPRLPPRSGADDRQHPGEGNPGVPHLHPQVGSSWKVARANLLRAAASIGCVRGSK
jgi:hypothetical protein